MGDRFIGMFCAHDADMWMPICAIINAKCFKPKLYERIHKEDYMFIFLIDVAVLYRNDGEKKFHSCQFIMSNVYPVFLFLQFHFIGCVSICG